MAVYDIVILAIVGLFALWGLWRGLIQAVFNFLGLVVGMLAAWQFAPVLASHLPPKSVPIPVRMIVAAIIILLSAWIAGKITSYIVKKIIRHGPVKSLDRFGGFLLGAAKGSVLVLSIVILIMITPFSSNLLRAARNAPVLDLVVKMSAPMGQRYKRAITRGIKKQLATAIQSTKIAKPDLAAIDLPSAGALSSLGDLSSLTISLDKLSPKAEGLLRELLKDESILGMDIGEQLQQLRASGTTIDLSLADFPPETRAFINKALSQPDAPDLDLDNINLDQLRSGGGSVDLDKLMRNVETDRALKALEESKR